VVDDDKGSECSPQDIERAAPLPPSGAGYKQWLRIARGLS
jgi:hypothetical protein